MKKSTALFVFGTRPEAIKLAPVIRAFAASEGWRPLVVLTGQHREMLQQVVSFFGIKADRNLDLMTENQSLATLSARLLQELDAVLAEAKPQVVIVQGDTTSACMGALAAFYRQLPVAHVEAGLRTYNKYSPFPEEVNRQIIGRVADLHLPPTGAAAKALEAEGVKSQDSLITGNTAIDALHQGLEIADQLPPVEPVASIVKRAADRRLILVTGHRRENHGQGMRELCSALRQVADTHVDCDIVYPVHPNPKVIGPVREALGDHPRVQLIDPQPYSQFIQLLRAAYLVITDSGGIQEEAPSLGVPLLVTRDTTERPEGVAAGTALLIGASRDAIVSNVSMLITEKDRHDAMRKAHNPYGDGHASGRILAACERFAAASSERL